MPRQIARRRAAVDRPTRTTAEPEVEENASTEDDTPRGRRHSRRTERPERARRQPDPDNDRDADGRTVDEDAEDTASSHRRARKGGRKDSSRGASLGRGMDAARKAHATTRFNDADKLTLAKDGTKTLLAFLEPEPFATYQQHFISNRAKGDKKSFTCPGDCPVCETGEGVRMLFLWNVYDMENGESKYWELGPNAFEQVLEYVDSEDYSPVDQEGLYFLASRKQQKNGFWSYKVDAVWDDDRAFPKSVEPLTEDEREEAMGSLFDDSVVEKVRMSDLEEVADEIYEQGD